MSKGFDYSKWDKIELSDDEDDTHPNIDKDSWFRMKHRSRVEREEREDEDKKRIFAEMAKHNIRIKELEHHLKKLDEKGKGSPVVAGAPNDSDNDDSDDDDDLDDRDGLRVELEELQKANADRQAKLDEYEKNKTWNVDNICHVAEERTIINPNASKTKFKEGYAVPDEDEREMVKDTFVSTSAKAAAMDKDSTKTDTAGKATANKATTPKSTAIEPKKKEKKKKEGPEVTEVGAMITYHEFTEKYADTVEEFMAIASFEKSKEFLLQHGEILLQENASNYLLLASLEDEMNGYREKMRLTARQSQIISNIAELAKSLNGHPGNVILPFFMRLEQKVFMDGFNEGTEGFIQKIIARSVKKKLEMDQESKGEKGEAVDLSDIPREDRLGPGGLDPLEVIETLPMSMQTAFESRDVNNLKEALLQLDPLDAERHMKRCIDSGLWTQPLD